MAITPLLFFCYEKFLLTYTNRELKQRKTGSVQPDQNEVILAGFGRIGQVIGRLLHSQGIDVTILEQDPGQIEIVKRFGWKTFYGDVSRLDLLQAAGADKAKLLILAIDDMSAAMNTIELAREHFPNLKIIVRAESRLEAYQFTRKNVPVVRSTFAPGLEMAEKALIMLDYPAYEAHTIAQKFQQYDLKQFTKAVQIFEDEKALITLALQGREELARMMATDESIQTKSGSNSWG
jgi:glutathione-regulated potassium-efflux system ancillary protein KefC